MIALLAAAIIQTGGVVEWYDESARLVSIQAVVKLPALDSRHRNLLRLTAGCLGRETKTFSAAQIASVPGNVGSRIRVTLMEDHLRVGMDVAPGDLSIGVSMMGSILREPTITPDDLQAVADDLQFRRFPYWRQALDLRPFEPPKYLQRDLDELMAVVFRPENVTLGVGGKLEPGLATRKWEEVKAKWTLGRPPQLRLEPDTSPGKPPTGGTMTLFDFQGPAFSPTDAAFTTKLLALTALGSGKSAALWRIAREKLGLSYRQESILYPVQGGFLPRLLIAHSGKEDLEKKAATLETGLLDDIKAWTDDDRKRAIGMAESYLTRGGELSPLYFLPDRPVGRDLGDQVFLRAYWQMKAGANWNPHQIVGRLGFVELEDLKTAAQEMVEKASLRIHVAR